MESTPSYFAIQVIMYASFEPGVFNQSSLIQPSAARTGVSSLQGTLQYSVLLAAPDYLVSPDAGRLSAQIGRAHV